MKCGICKTDVMNVYGSDRKTVLRQRPMRDAHDLREHKEREHPEAARASRAAADQRRRQQEELERIAEQRRRALRLAASKPAISPREGWGRRETEYILTTTAEMHISAGSPERGLAARYPEPEIFETYQAVQVEIARLQQESQDMLKRAWEAGITITEADIDAVQAAGEAGEQLQQREG
mgnify:CR=1 FL=1